MRLNAIHRDITDENQANYTISKIEPELNSVVLSGGFTIPLDQIRSVHRAGVFWHIVYVSSL